MEIRFKPEIYHSWQKDVSEQTSGFIIHFWIFQLEDHHLRLRQSFLATGRMFHSRIPWKPWNSFKTSHVRLEPSPCLWSKEFMGLFSLQASCFCLWTLNWCDPPPLDLKDVFSEALKSINMLQSGCGVAFLTLVESSWVFSHGACCSEGDRWCSYTFALPSTLLHFFFSYLGGWLHSHGPSTS